MLVIPISAQVVFHWSLRIMDAASGNIAETLGLRDRPYARLRGRPSRPNGMTKDQAKIVNGLGLDKPTGPLEDRVHGLRIPSTEERSTRLSSSNHLHMTEPEARQHLEAVREESRRLRAMLSKEENRLEVAREETRRLRAISPQPTRPCPMPRDDTERQPEDNNNYNSIVV